MLERAESAAAVEVAVIGANLAGCTHGRLLTDAILIEYRAFLWPNGFVNAGVVFPVR